MREALGEARVDIGEAEGAGAAADRAIAREDVRRRLKRNRRA